MTTQAMEVKKVTPLQEIRSTMEAPEFRQQLKMALPPHIEVDKFIRVAITAVSQDNAIANNRPSFYTACLKAAADGLLPDGKEAAFVKFGDSVTYMPMISGILKKVRNSGEIAMIDSQIVYEHDKFTFRPGIDQAPIFEPNWFGKRGAAIGVYAVAKTKEGSYFVEIMNKDQIAAIKNVARTKTVWDGAFGPEMWRKSAIRRLAKRLPVSTDIEQVIQRDDDLIDLNKETKEDKPEPQIEPVPPAPKPETSSRLSAAVNTKPSAQKEKIVENIAEPNEDPNVDELPI